MTAEKRERENTGGTYATVRHRENKGLSNSTSSEMAENVAATKLSILLLTKLVPVSARTTMDPLRGQRGGEGEGTHRYSFLKK